MARYAKIEGGVVDLIFDGNTPPFFERFFTTDADGNKVLNERVIDAGWEEVPDTVFPGWEKQPDGSFTAPPPPAPPADAEKADEAEAIVDQITQDNELFIALGRATVRLVLAATKDQIPPDWTEAQLVARFREEVRNILRSRRGL